MTSVYPNTGMTSVQFNASINRHISLYIYRIIYINTASNIGINITTNYIYISGSSKLFRKDTEILQYNHPDTNR